LVLYAKRRILFSQPFPKANIALFVVSQVLDENAYFEARGKEGYETEEIVSNLKLAESISITNEL
jgi:hypothetical protein